MAQQHSMHSMPRPPARSLAAASKARSKKRKIEDDSQPAKPKRQKPTKYSHDDGLLDLEAGVNMAFVSMDPPLLADHFARQTKRFGVELSSVELADLYMPSNAIRDTSSFTKTRGLENLADFLEQFAAAPGEQGTRAREQARKRLTNAPPEKGAPHTILVAGAGLRAADLVRACRKFQRKGNVVAKLFAKHFKVDEQVRFLGKSRTGIAVGTPARLIDLLDNGALSAEHLERIVVDASHIDQKKRGIMDMTDTMMPLARWLARKEFRERYTAMDKQNKPLDLLFF